MKLTTLASHDRARQVLMVQTPKVAVAIVNELQRLLEIPTWNEHDKISYAQMAMGLGCRNLGGLYPQDFFESYWKRGLDIQKKHGDATLCCNLFSNPTAPLPQRIDRFIQTDDPIECKNLALVWIEHAIEQRATPSYTKKSLILRTIKSTGKGLDPIAALDILCAFSTTALEQKWRSLYSIGCELGIIKYSVPIPFDESQPDMTSARTARKHLTANVNALIGMVNETSHAVTLPDLITGRDL